MLSIYNHYPYWKLYEVNYDIIKSPISPPNWNSVEVELHSQMIEQYNAIHANFFSDTQFFIRSSYDLPSLLYDLREKFYKVRRKVYNNPCYFVSGYFPINFGVFQIDSCEVSLNQHPMRLNELGLSYHRIF